MEMLGKVYKSMKEQEKIWLLVGNNKNIIKVAHQNLHQALVFQTRV